MARPAVRHRGRRRAPRRRGRALASGWWSTGPRVAEFEARVRALCRRRARGRGVERHRGAAPRARSPAACGPATRSILPSLNFVAAANAVAPHRARRRVLLRHPASDDPNLDPDDLEPRPRPRTRAIVALHYGGFPCDMDAVRGAARRARARRHRGRGARARRDATRGRACGTLGDVGLLQLLLEQEPADRRGRHGRDRRRRPGRARAAAALARDDHADAGTASAGTPRATTSWRTGLQLPDRRARGRRSGSSSSARLPAANAARARARRALPGRGSTASPGSSLPLGRARGAATSAHHLAVVVLPDGARTRDSPRRARRARDPDERPLPADPPLLGLPASAATRPLPRTDALADRLLTLPLFAHMRAEAGRRGRRRADRGARGEQQRRPAACARDRRRGCRGPGSTQAVRELARAAGHDAAPGDRPVVCVQGLGFVGSAMAIAVGGRAAPERRRRASTSSASTSRRRTGSRRSRRSTPAACPWRRATTPLARRARRGARAREPDRRRPTSARYELASVTRRRRAARRRPWTDGRPPCGSTACGRRSGRSGCRMPPGSLVIVETTVPPGTTEKVVAPEIATRAARARAAARRDPRRALLRARHARAPATSTRSCDFWRSYAGHTRGGRRRLRGVPLAGDRRRRATR